MADLYAYGEEVKSVFQLIGTLENDITKSIAWAFCNCPVFAKKVFDNLLEVDCDPDKFQIHYQTWEANKGITDLEITDNEQFYAIFEAKRGWELPGSDQLTMYSLRKDINDSPVDKKVIISMSECSLEYANSYLPFDEVNGIPVKHLSWRDLRNVALDSRAESSNSQKRIIDELLIYLGGIMTMQQKYSNLVYVVSLSDEEISGGYTYIDVVERSEKYFHPCGNGWPKEPPNYIAFRYDGMLQSIHHIEDYVVTKRPHDFITEMPDNEWRDNHFIYTLGPAIKPNKTIRTGGKIRAARMWVMLDLLLTSDTVIEARDLTEKRINS